MRIPPVPLLPPVLVALMLAWAGPTWACNTPVYRYAMYNWPPSPFGLFYVHQGPVPKEDAKTNRLLTEALKERADLPNLIFEQVDAAKPKALDALPKLIRQAWEGRAKDVSAIHVLVSPQGATLLKGRLSEKDARNLIDSPARRQIGELLEEGRAGVLVVLATADADRTRKTEEAVDKIVELVASGEISSPLDQTDEPDPAKSDDRAPPSKSRAGVARVTVSRSDAAETWLVKQLMATEEGLEELAKEPMVFAVFGRGRALPPCVGKGINLDNLTDCVSFLMGACSCMIKDQNPGADLLMAWDWEATAANLAAKEEDRDEPAAGGYREMGPAMEGKRPAGPVIVTTERKDPVTPDAKPASEKPRVEKPAEKAATPAPESTVVVLHTETLVYSRRHMWLYGGCLAAAAVLVLVIGLFWFRRR